MLAQADKERFVARRKKRKNNETFKVALEYESCGIFPRKLRATKNGCLLSDITDVIMCYKASTVLKLLWPQCNDTLNTHFCLY